MADNQQTNDPANLGQMAQDAAALDSAIEQAHAELEVMQGSASGADELSSMAEMENASIHEVPGIGRYAIPSHPGWQALLDVIHDRSADIDWSSANYPSFDGIIATVTESGPLDDPLDDRYEDRLWVHLRENLAAVRNFLMESYYADTPVGMTQEKALKSLEQIADFVGDGLHNNLRFLGVIPNHDPSKPMIDLHEAGKPNGAGAQYIYECILEMQRKSSWSRPFLSLLTGNAPLDWMLPSPDTTPFHDNLFGELNLINGENDALLSTDERLLLLEQERAQLQEKMDMSRQAIDMEAMGDEFLATAESLQGMEQLSQPVRDDAIRLAKDILEKLKLRMGNVNVLDGLGVNSGDSVAGLGALTGVGHVFEDVLAWGRGIDPTIMNDPAVMAATQTIGQFGHLAKTEALRLARAVGNTVLVDRLMARMAMLPAAFKLTEPTPLRDMLDRVERGIDTVLNRVKEVSGPNALVGHTPDKNIGGFMASTPTAGLSLQGSADGATNRDALGKRNAEVLMTEAAAQQAQAARIQSQTARRNPQISQAPTRSRGQQAVQQARQQQRQASGTAVVNPATLSTMTAQQRALLLRQQANLHAHDHDDEHDGHLAPQRINPLLANPALAKQLKAMKNTAGITNAPIGSGRSMYGQGLKPSLTPNLKAGAGKSAQHDDHDHHDHHEDDHPVPPHKGGMGR